MNWVIDDVMPGAIRCVEDYAGVDNSDNVVVITDRPLIAQALAKAIKDREASRNSSVECFYVGEVGDNLRPCQGPDERLPHGLAHALQNASIVFTVFDAGHSDYHLIRKVIDGPNQYLDQRVFHMSGVRESMFTRRGVLTLEGAQFKQMVDDTFDLAIALTLANKARIEVSNSDTDLELSLDGPENVAAMSTGQVRAGTWGNLPSGEAFALPTWATGQIYIDRAVSGFEPGIQPFRLDVEEGRISIEEDPGPTGARLQEMLDRLETESRTQGFPEDNIRQVCEFGIGTNPRAQASNYLEIEKILGTIHIAIGNNEIFGGPIKAPSHVDMVINYPTVTLNDKTVILQNGRLQRRRLQDFPKISYDSRDITLEDLSTNQMVKRIQDRVSVREETYLCRKWTDRRSNPLETYIGNQPTAQVALQLWNSFGSMDELPIRRLVTAYQNQIDSKRNETDTVLRLLRVMALFGVIEYTSLEGSYDVTDAGSSPQSVDYDVALSFAGEDRPYARELAELLRNSGYRVFYDEYERATLWGRDLYSHLSDVYRNRARFCITFLSRSYSDKLWTNHERQSAQARAFRENEEYILPIRLDDTEIPGVLETTGYLDARALSMEDVFHTLAQKLGEPETGRGVT